MLPLTEVVFMQRICPPRRYGRFGTAPGCAACTRTWSTRGLIDGNAVPRAVTGDGSPVFAGESRPGVQIRFTNTTEGFNYLSHTQLR